MRSVTLDRSDTLSSVTLGRSDAMRSRTCSRSDTMRSVARDRSRLPDVKVEMRVSKVKKESSKPDLQHLKASAWVGFGKARARYVLSALKIVFEDVPQSPIDLDGDLSCYICMRPAGEEPDLDSLVEWLISSKKGLQIKKILQSKSHTSLIVGLSDEASKVLRAVMDNFSWLCFPQRDPPPVNIFRQVVARIQARKAVQQNSRIKKEREEKQPSRGTTAMTRARQSTH
ncbi:hypothetical protein EJ06DRAFT_550931 [Trichodelitschia bisporula]|uniref:Uncharacterized protein n=1 Tax=Trichodelitschia bisporula TaxID=703511 RepID=A0A6G1HN02_9PEZI|nr:hypothetical protein EJ06DRAFT_550931 [Trichodelitschia bisporula]